MLTDIENQNHIISGGTVFWHKRGRLRGFHASVCGCRRRSVRFSAEPRRLPARAQRGRNWSADLFRCGKNGRLRQDIPSGRQMCTGLKSHPERYAESAGADRPPHRWDHPAETGFVLRRPVWWWPEFREEPDRWNSMEKSTLNTKLPPSELLTVCVDVQPFTSKRLSGAGKHDTVTMKSLQKRSYDYKL